MRTLLKIRYFTLYFLPFLALLCLLLFLADQRLKEKALKDLISGHQKELKLRSSMVNDYFDPLISDLYFLVNFSSTKTGNAKGLKQSLASPLYTFSQAGRHFQIRLLDTLGKEVVRVDFKNGQAFIIPEDQLQNKSHRNYFSESLALRHNEFYISPIDLNIEHGVIEIPTKPVVRLTSPTLLPDGQRSGMVIINSNPRELFEKIIQMDSLAGHSSQISILNNQGYWLNETLGKVSYGFMFDSLKNETFGYYFPEAWAHINHSPKGFFKNDKGLFIFQNWTYKNAIDFFNKRHGLDIRLPQNFELKLVARIPPETLHAETTQHRNGLYLISLVLILLGVSVVSTRNKIKEQQAIERLKTALILVRKNENTLSQKNEQLESFIRIASHDLKEPMASIRGVAETLKSYDQQVTDKTYLKYIDFILNCANRMEGLTRGVLDYAVTGRTSELAMVNCEELMEEITLDLQASIKSTNSTVQHQGLPQMVAYPLELKQLFQNLISNAIKYRREETPPTITITYHKSDKQYSFTVSDNGIGISKEDQLKIFAMFQRLQKKEGEEGLGIGLAIAKRIVELHEGTIWVESNDRGGCDFCFTIKNFSQGLS